MKHDSVYERHLMCVAFSPVHIMMVILGSLKIDLMLPEDTKIKRTYFSQESGTINFIVQAKSFEFVPLGQVIPVFNGYTMTLIKPKALLPVATPIKIVNHGMCPKCKDVGIIPHTMFSDGTVKYGCPECGYDPEKANDKEDCPLADKENKPCQWSNDGVCPDSCEQYDKIMNLRDASKRCLRIPTY